MNVPCGFMRRKDFIIAGEQTDIETGETGIFNGVEKEKYFE